MCYLKIKRNLLAIGITAIILVGTGQHVFFVYIKTELQANRTVVASAGDFSAAAPDTMPHAQQRAAPTMEAARNYA